MQRKPPLLVPVLAASLGLTSAAFGETLSVSKATLNGTQVTLGLTSPREGWVVIHEESNGRPGDYIGYAKVEKGENPKVTLQVTKKVEEGDELVVVLHEDKGRPNVFEFGALGDADVPTLSKGKPVTARISPK